VQEANVKYEFDRNNANYRSDYIALINKLQVEKCVSDDDDEVDAFRHDIENVEAGQP
jgi:hypothetical protein